MRWTRRRLISSVLQLGAAAVVVPKVSIFLPPEPKAWRSDLLDEALAHLAQERGWPAQMLQMFYIPEGAVEEAWRQEKVARDACFGRCLRSELLDLIGEEPLEKDVVWLNGRK